MDVGLTRVHLSQQAFELVRREHFADNIKRAGISGAKTPKQCGLCTHWETDPKDPSKGRCKLQKNETRKETCDCFSLAEL